MEIISHIIYYMKKVLIDPFENMVTPHLGVLTPKTGSLLYLLNFMMEIRCVGWVP